jgi:hypothetical protein
MADGAKIKYKGVGKIRDGIAHQPPITPKQSSMNQPDATIT